MTVTKVQVGVSSQDFGIDEIDLYDVSTSSNLNDTFFFSGASITTIAFNRFDEHQPSFDEDVHRAYPQLFPVMIDGGMGGWSSSDALTGIDLWLTLNPDMHYWLLGWGTNDAMDHASPEQYRANLQILIDKIKQAGHVPILGRLTYAHVAGKNEGPLDQEIQSLNAVIDQLTVENGLIRGPDFYQLFREHWQTYLDTDGIHPSPAGAIAMNEAWFEALRPYLNK